MSSRPCALAVLALLAFAGPVRAQSLDSESRMRDAVGPGVWSGISPTVVDRQGITPEVVAQPGAIDPETYRMGPGDMLTLRLWGRVARTSSLDVDAEGRVHLPQLESMRVAGRTLADVRRALIARMAEVYRGVNVEVGLARMRRFKVYVSGEVKSPGAYDATPVTRASEILSQAGLLDGASRRNVRRIALDGREQRVDTPVFELAGDLAGNPMLEDGDRLVVPPATLSFAAAGAFARPRRFELAPDDSLGLLVRLAGGALPSADLAGARLVRFRTASETDTMRIRLGGADDALRLQDGDALFLTFVPEYHQLNTITLVGEVARPGAYPIRMGQDRLSDIIARAGGFQPRADLGNVVVFRAPPPTGEGRDDFERLMRLSRDQMTETEYSRLMAELAQRKNHFRVDWRRLQAAGTGEDLDLLLVNNDVVRVDPLVTSVRVDGQVRNPGMVEYAPGRTLDEYVKLAGGFTSRAARGGVRVSRAGTGHLVPARSVRDLKPGDTVWVPEARETDYWTLVRDIISLAAQVAVVIVAVRR